MRLRCVWYSNPFDGPDMLKTWPKDFLEDDKIITFYIGHMRREKRVNERLHPIILINRCLIVSLNT